MNSIASPSVVSKSHPLQHYYWGNRCEAWSLADNESFSIKTEKMPPATEETLHFHKHSRQFFYILSVRAVFEIDGVIIIVHSNEGILIEPGSHHRIMNKEEEPLEFIVYSQPSVKNDRENLV